MNEQSETDANDRRGASRRSVLTAGTGAALAAAAVVGGGAAPAAASPHSAAQHSGGFATRIPVAPGVEVNVTDLNGGDRGTILFVPGWPLASPALESTLLFFADHGYRAIGLDQRGFGRSDAPYGPYTYDLWARDIRTVLEKLSLRDITLVGHSMGGAVALRHTTRFGGRVKKLVLAEVPVPKYVYGPESPDLAAGLASLISGYATDRAATIREALIPNFFATHTDIVNDPFLQYFERQCLDQASLPASRDALIALRDTDLTGDLARVTVPTLVFQATNDRIVPPAHGQAVAAGIRGARLVTFATAGHAIYVDERDKFHAEILRFVR